MTRNQKIALGCGGAGCLGLIVIAVAAGLIYYFARSYSPNSNYNYDVTTNRNSNSNDDDTTSLIDNDNANDNSSSGSSSAASMSDNDKHKLYHAALMTTDSEVVRRVSVKLGLMDDDFTPGADYEEFVSNHVGWVLRNTSFIQSINTPERAREYVNNNIPE